MKRTATILTALVIGVTALGAGPASAVSGWTPPPSTDGITYVSGTRATGFVVEWGYRVDAFPSLKTQLAACERTTSTAPLAKRGGDSSAQLCINAWSRFYSDLVAIRNAQ